MMLHEQVIAEIKQIPSERLDELYDLIHSFRLRLNKTTSKPISLTFSQRWQGRFKITTTDARLDYLTQRYQL
ncbi:hypothetical protein TI05_04620 [Achromatium sp. WMS3]|nr:hypothetical protein TI05_04620 [Achromatium sp. WMS3]